MKNNNKKKKPLRNVLTVTGCTRDTDRDVASLAMSPYSDESMMCQDGARDNLRDIASRFLYLKEGFIDERYFKHV